MSQLLYLTASKFTRLQGDRFFIKTFLVDSSINANKWAVTEKALRRNISTFIGKPIVLTPDFAHPEVPDGDGDKLFVEQEKFRIGIIIDIGLDEATGKGWALAEITDRKAIDLITQTGINFVSPSIVFGKNDIEIQDGVEVVTNFEGAHLAIVKDHAYGMQKAQIKGQCKGGLECITQLQKVQASVERSKCGQYIVVNQDTSQRILKADRAMEKCIQSKIDAGLTIDEQALAICYEETRKGECNVDQLGNCVTNSSLEDKINQNKLMTANDDEIKKQEEEKARKAEDEEKEKEEARKAEEHDKEDEARKADDEDKEKKVDEIAKLKAELEDLKEDQEKAKKEAKAKPVVDKIVTAKVRLNLIKESETEKEFDSLVTLPLKELEAIASQYSNIKADTPYSVLNYNQASTASYDGDALLIRLGSSE